MNKQAIIEQISAIVDYHRGKVLLDSECDILLGVLDRKTYREISDQCNISLSYCLTLSASIFKILGSHFNFPVTKNTFIYFCRTYLASEKI